MADLGEEAFSSQMKVVATFLRLLEELMRNKQQDLRYGTKTQRRGILGRMKDFVGGIFKKVYDGTFGRLSRNGKDYGQLDLNDPAVASSLVGTETTNAVNTGLVGSATAIAKNMVIGGTELGDVDKMYQTGKSAIKGSVGAARVGSDLVKDTVDTAKTTAKAFKAGLNGEDIDLSGTKSRSGSNLAKGTKKAAKEGFRAAKRAAIKDSELEDVDNLYQEAKGLSKAAVSSTKGAVSNTRKSWKMLKRSTARIKALSRKRFTAGAGNKFNQQMYRYMRSAAYQSVSTGGGIINTAKNVLSYAYWSVRMAANGIGAILGALFGAIGVLIIPVIIIIAVICTISGGSKGENASVGSLTGDEATIAQYLIDKGVDRTHIAAIMGNMFQFIFDFIDAPIDLSYVRQVHQLVSNNLVPDSGQLRYFDVYIGGTSWQPEIPDFDTAKAAIEKIANMEPGRERALKMFGYLCRSQLFSDGNKRTAQLIANKMLIADGCGILAIPKEQINNFETLLLDFYETNKPDKFFSFLTKEAIYGLDRTVPSSQNLKVKCKAATLGSNALKTRSNTVGISKTQNADRTAHTEHIE